MTLTEAGEIFAYWEENPPAHLMVQTIARLLGWAPRLSPQPPDPAAPPPGMAVVHGGDLSMPPPLDAAALLARNRARAVAIAIRGRR